MSIVRMDPAEVVTSLIEGTAAPADEERTAVSENPARPDEPVGRYATVGLDAVDEALGASVEALGEWRHRSPLERGAILRRAAQLLEARSEEIAALQTAEQGKTIGESRRDLARAVETVHYHASSAWWTSGETYWSDSSRELVRTLRVPIGVVAVITPWNYPVTIPLWKIVPALVHGNTVVWKPATLTPIVSVRLAEIFHEAGVPVGALQVVLGTGGVGAALVGDERVAGISFTGSNAVGRQVAAGATARNAKFQLELGGQNPAIVLADANLDVATAALTRAVANGTGQKCTATRRIIVEQPVHDALVERLLERFAALRVGDGADPQSEVGPLVSAAARDEVAGEIARALDEGCVLLGQTEGVPATGAFLGPTLLGARDQSARICREEVFGPVAVVIPATSPEEALALAADTRYGLSASLFTNSERIARLAAEELPVGLLNINRPSSDTALHVPFGGTKASSAPGPPEGGTTARQFYTELKTVLSTAVS